MMKQCPTVSQYTDVNLLRPERRANTCTSTDFLQKTPSVLHVWQQQCCGQHMHTAAGSLTAAALLLCFVLTPTQGSLDVPDPATGKLQLSFDSTYICHRKCSIHALYLPSPLMYMCIQEACCDSCSCLSSALDHSTALGRAPVGGKAQDVVTGATDGVLPQRSGSGDTATFDGRPKTSRKLRGPLTSARMLVMQCLMSISACILDFIDRFSFYRILAATSTLLPVAAKSPPPPNGVF